MTDPLAARLRAVFQMEMEELTRAMSSELLELEGEADSRERIRSLFRIAHTLKGAARAAQVHEVEGLCHDLESFLAPVRDGERSLGEEAFPLLFMTSDALADAADRLRRSQPLDAEGIRQLRSALRSDPEAEGQTEHADEDASAAPRATDDQREAPRETPRSDADRAAPSGGSSPDRTRKTPAEHVRIATHRLDALGSTTGELLIAARRVSARSEELAELHELASRTQGSWRRTSQEIRDAARRVTLPATILRAVDQLDEELGSVARKSWRIAKAVRSEAQGLTHVTDEVRERVLGIRLRPFADACVALPRTVRDLSAAAGKEVRLEISGEEVQADRAIIDQLQEVLLQLVRNAVDHGIEDPEERERAGKPRVGMIRVEGARRGRLIIVRVSDDGRGPDLAAIRARAAARGLPVPVSEEEVSQILFESGFSTREVATPVSGRGVGLDVVRQGLERIRGHVQMTWVEGAGTTFTLECPPALTIVRAVLAAAGPDLIAFPTIYIEKLDRIKADELRRAEGRDAILTSSGPVPLAPLSGVLGGAIEAPATNSPIPVVRLLAGGRRIAVAVDELVAEEEIVISGLERIGTPPPLIAGAALLASGRIALVMNVAALVTEVLQGAASDFGAAVGWRRGAPRKRVLLADDSFTTRMLEESILRAAGYEVIAVADGAEAWEILQDQEVDALVTDVEMPRMGGFELCEAVRRSARHSRLPIILVTAMEREEDRSQGLKLGADAYLPKSTFDQQHLLATLEQLIGPL